MNLYVILIQLSKKTHFKLNLWNKMKKKVNKGPHNTIT